MSGTATVRVTHRFAARPERVFDAWLDPRTAAKWLFATPTGKITRCRIDARVGGRFSIVRVDEHGEFDHEGEYSRADVDAVRQQLRDPAWSRVVGVRSKRRDGDVDIYFKDGANGQLGGMVLICAEPRELTIIHIIGNIDLDKLAQLDGEFSIPRLDTSHARRESR